MWECKNCSKLNADTVRLCAGCSEKKPDKTDLIRNAYIRYEKEYMARVPKKTEWFSEWVSIFSIIFGCISILAGIIMGIIEGMWFDEFFSYLLMGIGVSLIFFAFAAITALLIDIRNNSYESSKNSYVTAKILSRKVKD